MFIQCHSGAKVRVVEGEVNDSIIKGNNFDKISFLKQQQGTWHCYSYMKDDAHSIEHYDEDYAKEFSKHAYFIIRNDSLRGQGIYNTDIYAYKYPVKFKHYDEESIFITALKPQKDSLVFIRPYNSYEYYWENNSDLPYYRESPLNGTMMYLNERFVVYNRGYFFLFRKEAGYKSNTEEYGLPGDDRNYFKVELFYENKSIEETFSLFGKDYPYGQKQLLSRNENKESITKHDWKKEPVLKLEKYQENGKFVLEIEKTKDGVKMIYYCADGYDHIGDEYEG